MVIVLPMATRAAYDLPVDAVALPLDLEQFVTEAVAAGDFRDASGLIAAGLRLLQRQMAARAELLASVLASQEEAERNGYLTGEEVAARVRATIARKTSAAA